jgi:carbamoyltransferase
MIVLGFHQGAFGPVKARAGHDAGAALIIDGEIVAAAEEERFARIKHTPRFPEGAIAYCLKAGGVELAQVDRICFPWSPELDRQNMARAEVELSTLAGRHSHRSMAHARIFDDFERRFGFAVPALRRRCLPHHLCHAASAFYCSPFERAAFLVIDAYGEMVSVSTGIGRETQLEPMEQTLMPTSLGVFYSSYTRVLGFLGPDDEYKVMGLAAYGDPARFRDLFRTQWRVTEHGVEQVADGAARTATLELARYRRLPTAPIEQDHRDLAAALQESLEEQVLHLARRVRERTGEADLCLAGGVALNSTANGKLARSGLFRDVFIQPAASDAGTPLGAALLEYHRHVERRRPIRFSAYLGPEFSDAEIDAACGRFAAEIEVSRPADLAAETVRRLCAQQILGWFQGRMEFGPRALGNRSILADPRDTAIRERINRAVKHREMFRPFAPAVLAEHAAACFAMGGLSESPFMLLTFLARPEHRSGFEAAVHRDGTSRIQTVTHTQNPRFHALLARFHEETGVPMLLNTSFNVNGEPIVCSPEDAIESFLSTDLDALVLGDRVVVRRPRSPEALLALRPCLQAGVQLHASIAVAGPGGSPQWRDAVVTRRHVRAELEASALAILLACDGRRTGLELLEDDAICPAGADAARELAAVLERLLRMRLIRLA